MLLVNVPPQDNPDLREPIHNLPESVPVSKTDLLHPVRAYIDGVVMKCNDCRQVRMLLQGFGQEVQLRISQSAINLAGHGGIQHDELPPAVDHMANTGVVFAGNPDQVIDMIMVAGDPD